MLNSENGNTKQWSNVLEVGNYSLFYSWLISHWLVREGAHRFRKPRNTEAKIAPWSARRPLTGPSRELHVSWCGSYIPGVAPGSQGWAVMFRVFHIYLCKWAIQVQEHSCIFILLVLPTLCFPSFFSLFFPRFFNGVFSLHFTSTGLTFQRYQYRARRK